MSNLLITLCRVSQTLFSNLKVHKSKSMREAFQDTLEAFNTFLGELTLEDFHLTPEKLNLKAQNPAYPPPISYVNVFENDTFSLTLFGLSKHTSIPLHDHPEMNAFMKCVYGSVKVTSYSILKDVTIPRSILAQVRPVYRQNIVAAITSAEDVLTSDSFKVGSLTPLEKNIHKVKPLSDLAVIADIISPPYTASTNSSYYEVIDITYDSTLNRSITWLCQTPNADYYCETVDYTGPPIIV
ncbi:hypothetical protein TYRP_018803 [Tyrophagus putrescentiae]|nr:hypothetical protein TYRP_018803 [Tyrophagus putrescentiae]